MNRQFKSFVAILLLLLQTSLAFPDQAITNIHTTSFSPVEKPQVFSPPINPENKIDESFKTLPLTFEPNRGQADDSVKFIARGKGYNLLLKSEEAIIAFDASGKQHILRMKLESAFNSKVIGVDPLPGKANYFIGNNPKQWHTNIPTYSRVKSVDVYRGIDMVYYSVQGVLEYDFIVKPGADPKQIAMSIEGADQMKLDPSGDLIVSIPDEEIRFPAPRIYQEVNGVRQTIAGAFVLKQNRQIAFDLSSYDTKLPLVIDPQLVYATYLGGTGGNDGGGGTFGGDIAKRIAVDSAGSAYITGQTFSVNFPLKTPIQGRYAGSTDAFVTKLSPDGSSIVYSTYLGGSLGDGASGIALNPAKSAFVTGVTGSFDFPLKNPMQNSNRGGGESFVAKLSPAGNSLVYSTYLGGSDLDNAEGIVIGKGKALANAAYIYGSTSSTNFPLAGATQTNYGGGQIDGFVTVLNPAGAKLIFSTYLGNKREERITTCAINPERGDLYLGAAITDPSQGETGNYIAHFKRGSSGANGTIQKAAGFWEFLLLTDLKTIILVVQKLLRESKSARIWFDFITNPPASIGGKAAQAAAGELYLSLNSCVSPENGPECNDVGVVIALDPDLNYKRDTNFGGEFQQIFLNDQAIDSQGRVYVVGGVESRGFRTVNPIQSSYRGGTSDAFIVTTGPAGSQVVFASYIGGGKEDVGQGVAVDPQGNIYVTGYTSSTNFVNTPGAFQTKKNGPLYDAFIVKISPVQ